MYIYIYYIYIYICIYYIYIYIMYILYTFVPLYQKCLAVWLMQQVVKLYIYNIQALRGALIKNKLRSGVIGRNLKKWEQSIKS